MQRADHRVADEHATPNPSTVTFTSGLATAPIEGTSRHRGPFWLQAQEDEHDGQPDFEVMPDERRYSVSAANSLPVLIAVASRR